MASLAVLWLLQVDEDLLLILVECFNNESINVEDCLILVLSLILLLHFAFLLGEIN